MTISTSLPNHIKSESSIISQNLSKSSAIDWQQTSTPNDPIPIVQDFEPLLCFAPPVNTVIHRPMVNLSEFMSSYSICLNSYEDRIGVTTKGERLCTERLNTLKESFRSNSKRMRHDSGSEKKASPDSKRLKNETTTTAAATISSSKIVNGFTSNINSSDTSSSSLISTEDSKLNTTSTNIAVISSPYANLKSNALEISGITRIGQQINDVTETTTLTLDAKIKTDTFEHINSNGDVDEMKQETVITSLSNGNHHDDTVPLTITIPTTNAACSSSSATIVKPTTIKRKENKYNTNTAAIMKKKENRREPFRSLLSEDVVQQIKKGWTVLDVGDLTIGDLYIMFGQDFKVNLIYNWIEQNIKMEQSSVSSTQCNLSDNNAIGSNDVKPELAPAPPSLGTSVELGNKLKQLLLLASMTEKVKRKTNNCACDRGYNKLMVIFLGK